MNDVTEQHKTQKQSMNDNGEKENGSNWALKNFHKTSNKAKI